MLFRSVRKSQAAKLNEQITAKDRELAKILRYKQSLYEDWKSRNIKIFIWSGDGNMEPLGLQWER